MDEGVMLRRDSGGDLKVYIRIIYDAYSNIPISWNPVMAAHGLDGIHSRIGILSTRVRFPCRSCDLRS